MWPATLSHLLSRNGPVVACRTLHIPIPLLHATSRFAGHAYLDPATKERTYEVGFYCNICSQSPRNNPPHHALSCAARLFSILLSRFPAASRRSQAVIPTLSFPSYPSPPTA